MASDDYFPVEPDFPVAVSWLDGVNRYRSMGGKEYRRITKPPQRIFTLQFIGRPTTDLTSIQEWSRQYETDYFAFTHKYFVSEVIGEAPPTYIDRTFPVNFNTVPQWQFKQNDTYDILVELIEAIDCDLESADYPNPEDGHPVVDIEGTTSGSDMIFIYAGYGFRYFGTGTITLDGSAATDTEIEVPLNLHRVYITSGTGTLEAII